MVADHAHHQRRETESDALGRSAHEQSGERQRQHGERAANDDDRQRGENRGPPVRTGSEPAEDGCGDGAAEQGEVSIHCALSSETWNVVSYRYSTAHQVVIDADTRVVVVGRPLPGNRHDSRGWEESCAKAAVGNTMTIADGGYQGTGLVIPPGFRSW
jgi:hypothetical protein